MKAVSKLLIFSVSLLPLLLHDSKAGSFRIEAGDFLIDGKPFAIRSGEIHYSRVPREYWSHRLRMVRAMGLNTISTYVFWNLHESQPGKFQFTGDADAAEFCRLAQKEDLKVILRPGPYVCSEWDMGGLPWWLLKTQNMRLRSTDPAFLNPVRSYFKALGAQLAPLQLSRGGPIIMVQIENEYGSWGKEKEYLCELRDALKEAGFEAPFFTTDLPQHLKNSFSTNLFTTLNFGSAPEKNFNELAAWQPAGPQMCQEFFAGWYDAWGRGHSQAPADWKAPDLEWMLSRGKSFNLYMVHGGTTFGFWAGANERPYRPHTTSYDYDAPISEAGWATPKYQVLRNLIAKHVQPGGVLPEVPERPPVIEIAAFGLTEFASSLEQLGPPHTSPNPLPMEAFDQAHGCILYETKIGPGKGETLVIKGLRDLCTIFVDGQPVGEIHRDKNQKIVLPARTNTPPLKLLVEGLGRISYGRGLATDRKGISGSVFLQSNSGTYALRDWNTYLLPFDQAHLNTFKFAKGHAPKSTPALYRGGFSLQNTGDTFLDMRNWTRGMVWVNGHNLGRFWRIGPQQTLYCPGPWLKKGRNEVIVLEMSSRDTFTISGLNEPVLNQLENPGPQNPGT